MSHALFTGPLGATVILLMTLSVLGSLWLAVAAARRQPRHRLAAVPVVVLAAATVSTGAAHLWPSLAPLLWAVIPLQVLPTVLACLVLFKDRHIRPPAVPAASVTARATGTP